MARDPGSVEPTRDGADARPLASVLVCTCNRGENAAFAVRSILASDYPNLEVIVLDQSSDDRTVRSLEPLQGAAAPLTIIRLPLPGKPRALNEGWRRARGKYVLLTDDDCEVPKDWARSLVAEFEDDERLGCLYGSVLPASHDESDGYIPHLRIESDSTIFTLAEYVKPGWKNFGMGANMALRRDVLDATVGWDECIGPGARFHTGDDVDIAVQVLRKGYAIGFRRSPSVLHFGFRRWGSAKQDLERSGIAQGAIFIKHLRCGTYFSGGVRGLKEEAARCLRRVLKRTPPFGIAYPLNWFRGVRAGLLHPVNRSTSQYVPLDAEENLNFTRYVGQVVLRKEQQR
jgi:O-antigen biosynthesis protein